MKTYNFNEQLKDILKESNSYSYEYRYYFATEKGDLLVDSIRNTKYGNSRKGYEQFVQQETNLIEHSGRISLRPYTIKDSNGNLQEKGIVCETRIDSDLSERDKQLATLERQVWEYFCEVFSIDTPLKEDLVLKLMYIDEFATKYPKDKIKWCLEQIEERDNFSGDELDNVTEMIIDIGNIK